MSEKSFFCEFGLRFYSKLANPTEGKLVWDQPAVTWAASKAAWPAGRGR